MKCIILLLFLNQEIKQLIDSSSIIYKDVCYSIAIHESGNFTSSLYRRNNNIFGFKGRNGYVKYKSKRASVEAYQKFESRIIKKYRIVSSEAYLNRLSRFYAKNKHWRNHIKKNL